MKIKSPVAPRGLLRKRFCLIRDGSIATCIRTDQCFRGNVENPDSPLFHLARLRGLFCPNGKGLVEHEKRSRRRKPNPVGEGGAVADPDPAPLERTLNSMCCSPNDLRAQNLNNIGTCGACQARAYDKNRNESSCQRAIRTLNLVTPICVGSRMGIVVSHIVHLCACSPISGGAVSETCLCFLSNFIDTKPSVCPITYRPYVGMERQIAIVAMSTFCY